MKKQIFGTLLAIQLALPSLLFAHDAGDGEVELFGPPEVLDDAQQLFNSGLGAQQSVVDQFKIWEAGQTLRVCFFSGEQDAKDYFVEMAEFWDAEASISFDFGSRPDYHKCSSAGDFHIRVSLANGGGNWSYVGTDSTKIPQSNPSLNITVVEPFSLNNRRSLGGTILHELGHALGLLHEHQSPEANCDEEINWMVLYQELAKPPNNWDADKVDHNLRPLMESPRLRTSEYDSKSIMHYALPARWFKNGSSATCFVKKNTSLSQLDIAAAHETYPSSPQKQDDRLNKLHSALAVRLEKSGASQGTVETLNGLINTINSGFPDRDVDADLEVKVTKIGSAKTLGDCSPIITDAGDVTITCN
ncbi:hypothetical protein IWQ55_001352 [Labrenzia sp. EL_208]|nr:hypothetical protein [Labrenzia sp. EL_132]MBG6228154.1 hypothetical protein [Labrenzia sp. EL_208]